VSALAVGGLLAGGLTAGLAPAAHADVLDVHGDSDLVQASVVSVTSNWAGAENAKENVRWLKDRNPATKWYASGSGNPSTSSPVYAIYSLSTAQTVSGYSLTASADSASYPDRDPKDWTILGSNTPAAVSNWADPSWQVLDTRSGQAFAVNNLTRVYTVAAPASYRYYQLRVTAKKGTTSNLQIADWTLRGVPVGLSSTLVSPTASWSYLDDATGTVDPAGDASDRTAWTQPGATLNGTWSAGTAPFGAKRGSTTPGNAFPVATPLALDRDGTTTDVVPGYFFRTTFAIANQSALDAVGGLLGTLVYDDSATVYLNGTAVAWFNGAASVPSNLSYGTGYAVGDPRTEQFLIPPTGLVVGDNVLAVELHNSDATSSDIYFALPSLRATTAPVAGSPSVVSAGSQWSYLEDGDVDPANGAADRTAWTQVGATLPGTWKTAVGPFGAKNGSATPNLGAAFPVTTVLKYYLNGTTTPVVGGYFFRTTFDLDQAGLGAIKGLYGTIVHDDAATVYVNGVNVADYPGTNVPTSNLGYGGNNNGDPATEAFMIPASALRAGENVLSVELHNVNATSSDVYFAMPSLVAMSDAVVPVPFGTAVTGATYASDTVPAGEDGGEYFTDILDAYPDLRANHPDILSSQAVVPGGQPLTSVNDRLIVAINNAAAGDTPAATAARTQATYDADSCCSTYTSTSDGLGSVLGPIFYNALQNGLLPRTKWLLDNVGDHYDDGAAKSFYANVRPPSRLGFTDGTTCSNGLFTGPGAGRIVRNYKPDVANAYDSWCNNGSYPSGHTFSGYIQGTTMATVLPELAPEFLARASTYADNRTVLGAHYPLDLMGGRMSGQATVANRWADPVYRDVMAQATDELRSTLSALCVQAGYGSDLVACARAGEPASAETDLAQTYRDRLTYSAYTTADGVRHTDGFPQVFPQLADQPLIVPAGAPDMLRSTFPDLTDQQRAIVLQATALPGGYALDKTRTGQPSWERVDLLAALQATVTVNSSGDLVVDGQNMGDGSDYDDATLSGLSAGGSPVAGFSPATTSYSVVLPVGTTTAPTITATASGTHAVVSVTQATSLPGTATVRVTAQDGTTVRTYTVSFTTTTPSSDATLSALTVGGSPVAGFSPATMSYDVVLPTGTTSAPTVTATATESHATIVYIQAASVPGTALVQVTAQDGVTQQAYAVSFTVASDGGDDGHGGNPGGTPVTAVLTALAAPATYGTPARVMVSVKAAGSAAQGSVRVSEGSRLLGAGVLVRGTATVSLPRTLGAGSHALSVTYVPSSSQFLAPAPRVLSLVVAKADARLGKVKVTKGKHGKNKVVKGKKATLKVVLKGVAGAALTGKVSVKVGKKAFGKAKVKRSGKKYVAEIKTKTLKKKGKIKVLYSGSANLTKKTFTTKVKVV